MITIQGNLGFNASINRAKKAMVNLSYLRQFLPAESYIDQVDATTFNFMAIRNLGMFPAKIPGVLTVTPNERDSTIKFVANAKHSVAGSVKIEMDISFTGDRQSCVMTYVGLVTATRLVGSFLKHNEDKAALHIEEAFVALGRQLALNQKTFEARLARERLEAGGSA